MSSRKVTKEDAEMMRKLREEAGFSYAEIAKIFKVSPETARRNINQHLAKRHADMETERYHIKKAEKTNGVSDYVKDLTLAEVIQKVENGAKKIEGNINNATLDDIAMLNEIFDVTFTVHMK